VPTVAPRASQLQAEAERYGAALLDALGYVGVLAVEFFETERGLVANEMAPRVHNSGHWTQDGSCTSQFENHLRAILGLPLGPTVLRGGEGGGAAMVNFIGGLPAREEVLAARPSGDGAAGPEVLTALHLYDKAPRPGRKVGHLNLWGRARDRVHDELRELAGLASQVGDG